MSKEKQRPEAILKLQKLIKEGFKEYDGDIMEEALEVLDSINDANQLMYKVNDDLIKSYSMLSGEHIVLRKEFEDLEESEIGFKTEVVALTNANNTLTAKISELLKAGDIIYKGCNEMGRIEFGTGTLFYAIKKESAITVKELIQAIHDAALVVPLPEMTNAIKKLK